MKHVYSVRFAKNPNPSNKKFPHDYNWIDSPPPADCMRPRLYDLYYYFKKDYSKLYSLNFSNDELVLSKREWQSLSATPLLFTTASKM